MYFQLRPTIPSVRSSKDNDLTNLLWASSQAFVPFVEVKQTGLNLSDVYQYISVLYLKANYAITPIIQIQIHGSI